MPYQQAEELRIEQEGPVAILTLNRPDKLNSFSDEMHVAAREVWYHLSLDRSVRAVVLTGAGRAFSSGGDIIGFIEDYESQMRRRESMRGAQRLLDAMLEFPKPVIAAVNGPAIGLGCTVATSCDIVFIDEDTWMSDPHVDIALVAGDGGAVNWPLFMSVLKAKYYLLTGDRIPAKECVELGLANFAVPGDQLMDKALALANRLAKKPQQALEETKRAVNLHLRQASLLVSPFACAAEQESFATDDIVETINEFREKVGRWEKGDD
jgi:enoyl-CoA hydratase/carnithine racemase